MATVQIDYGERTKLLRERLLVRKNPQAVAFLRDNPVVSANSLRASEGIGSWQLRRGLQTRDRLASTQFVIDDLELLIGRLDTNVPSPDSPEVEEARAFLAQYPGAPGQTGHCELNLEPILTGGIDGVAASIRRRMGEAQGETADAYPSFLHALDGFAAMIGNAAKAAADACTAAMAPAAAGHEADRVRQAELRAIEASCHRIATEPPASFRDAIQLVWFCLFGAMHGDVGVHLVVPGHLDRTLRPFYEADLAAGHITREKALALIEGLYLLINDYVADGLAMSVMVGGRDADGRDVTNDLSYLCLEALRRTRLIYPTVGICWHDGTPEDLVQLALDLIAQGIATPAFFGDETIQRGLKALGVPVEDACHYINSTCVEITPARGSNIWVASPYFSMCRYLLEQIEEEAQTDTPSPDAETFRARCLNRLSRAIADSVAELNDARRQRRERGRKPFQSVFTRDCIERGRDIDDGGARYNWVECSFVGLANFTDSVHVVQEEVFLHKRLTFAELHALLASDFAKQEPVRQRFLHHAKYGHDDDELDRAFGETIQFLRAECAKHRMEPDDSPFVPGAFCWIMHEVLGRECGATPDGRKAGTAFADGCGPAQGRETHGPTAAILSTTSWDHSPMIGGLAYNMKFNTSLFATPQGHACLRDLVLTFLRRGGFETQINVVDADTLRKAREHPEQYRDLVVRIGGYCDYFARLSPEMQDEVIMRTEFPGA